MKSWISKNQETLLALVRAGLWEKDVQLLSSEEIDYETVYNLSEEQSVVGLVAAGIDVFKAQNPNFIFPQVWALQFVGSSLQLEQQNLAMNDFIVKLMKKLENEIVHALLVKGQGVAQCYARPLWRESGDIDLLLDADNYERAKDVLLPIADNDEGEEKVAKHQALNIRGFEVELHGRMPFYLSQRVDEVIDGVLAASLKKDGIRIWRLGETDVYLPKPDNDVIIVFTHFLLHFFVEGVGLRQICDWCRLLWTFRDSLNHELLESRIRKAGLMTEWKAFASLAVNTLGMPEEAMPFYSRGYEKRAGRILRHILKSGNMGHNNDLSYRAKYGSMASGIITFYRRVCDFVRFTFIFPVDAPRFFVTYVFSKV